MLTPELIFNFHFRQKPIKLIDLLDFQFKILLQSVLSGILRLGKREIMQSLMLLEELVTKMMMMMTRTKQAQAMELK